MVLLPRVGVDPLPNCFGRLRDTQKISKTETRLSDLIDRSAQLGDGVRGHGAVAAKRRRAHVPVVLAGLARQIMARRQPPRGRTGWSAMTPSKTTCDGQKHEPRGEVTARV